MFVVGSMGLDGAGILEQVVEACLFRLQVRVSTNVLLRNEDVGHGGLARQLAQGRLDGRAVVNLVQLDGEEFRTAVTEQLLCLAAVGTVGLGEDGDGVLVDDGLDFGLCGGHGGGAGGAVEEAGEEGYGCGSRGPEPVGLGVGWLDGLALCCVRRACWDWDCGCRVLGRVKA